MKKKQPSWLKKRIKPGEANNSKVKKIIQSLNINTVCDEAKCPNKFECFSQNTATFMILGDVCTRNCRFCAVEKGKPEILDIDEPKKISKAVFELGLKYVVITSVTRDDLQDQGVNQFIQTTREIKKRNPKTIIELLTPDFSGKRNLIYKLLKKGKFEVLAHNIETVPRLYSKVRPEANYERSLNFFKIADKINLNKKIIYKSGIMLGLGERDKEVIKTFKDLKEAGCELLTIGQYLQPSEKHVAIKKFVTPSKFEFYKERANKLGFKAVVAGSFVRSSYKAVDLFEKI